MVQEESLYAAKKRPVLDKLLTEMQPGDTLVVWGFERIACSLGDLMDLIERLRKRGIVLHALREGFLSSSEHGDTVLKTIGSIAAFKTFIDAEKSILSQEAIKARGIKVGGERKLSDRDMQMVFALIDEGIHKNAIAEKFGISEKNLNKWLRDPRYMGEVIMRPRRNKALKQRLREEKGPNGPSEDDEKYADTVAETS